MTELTYEKPPVTQRFLQSLLIPKFFGVFIVSSVAAGTIAACLQAFSKEPSAGQLIASHLFGRTGLIAASDIDNVYLNATKANILSRVTASISLLLDFSTLVQAGIKSGSIQTELRQLYLDTWNSLNGMQLSLDLIQDIEKLLKDDHTAMNMILESKTNTLQTIACNFNGIECEALKNAPKPIVLSELLPPYPPQSLNIQLKSP